MLGGSFTPAATLSASRLIARALTLGSAVGLASLVMDDAQIDSVVITGEGGFHHEATFSAARARIDRLALGSVRGLASLSINNARIGALTLGGDTHEVGSRHGDLVGIDFDVREAQVGNFAIAVGPMSRLPAPSSGWWTGASRTERSGSSGRDGGVGGESSPVRTVPSRPTRRRRVTGRGSNFAGEPNGWTSACASRTPLSWSTIRAT